MKQSSVKRKMLECIKVGEKVILSIQTKNQMEKVVKRRRLKYLSVVGKVKKNEKTKESISEEEEIGIRKCRRKSRIDKINEEVKGWTSSLKNKNVLLK